MEIAQKQNLITQEKFMIIEPFSHKCHLAEFVIIMDKDLLVKY